MVTAQEIHSCLSAGESINEVCSKYNLSFKELMNIAKQYHHTKDRGFPKYISKCGNRYRIIKWNNNRLYKQIYGSFETLEEAITIRDKLIANNWDLPAKEVMGMMYIQPNKKGWKIQKFGKNHASYAGRFKTKNDAIIVRDKLVEYDWNLNYLDTICEELGVERIGS